jgi:phosphoglycerate dehydrogenase-like enzyme
LPRTAAQATATREAAGSHEGLAGKEKNRPMRAVVYVTLARAEVIARLRALLGDDLVVVDDADALAAAIDGADALFIGDMLYHGAAAEAVRRRGTSLKWVQVLTAGYNNLKRFGVPGGAQVTNAGDALAVAVGLHAIGLLLAVQRQFPAFARNQQRHGWDHAAVSKVTVPYGATALVLGFGHIGKEIGRLMQALGAHVIGVSRAGTPDAAAHEMMPLSDWRTALPRADAILVALALEPATRNLIDAEALALCKPNAVIVNIARGGIIDQAALTRALADGTIAGAGLDVTEPEPLPPDDPLWDAPNVLISPHCAGAAGHVTNERIAAVAADNLERFMKGEPLQNIVRL